ncbi:sulfonate dioxygenase, partial [Tremellales sp. Uapishka_1]
MPAATAVRTVEDKISALKLNLVGGETAPVQPSEEPKVVDPFNYVGEVLGSGPGADYPYTEYLPHNPKRTESEPPLTPTEITDKGFSADRTFSRLRAFVEARGGRIRDIGVAVGTVIEGDVKMEELGDGERDDLAALVGYRGVVFFRKQSSFTIEEQLALGRHFGPLHTHPTYAVPRKSGLDEVVVIYQDQNSKPDPYSYSKADLFHSDTTYELQPPGVTMLKLITTPEVGGDTLWSSGYALYSSLSKPYQKYLESLSALHTGHNQASARTDVTTIPRREPVDAIHPVVRVHPVTGYKSIFVNPGFVTRLIGVPKAESENTLKFLRDGFAQNADAIVRWRWEKDDVAVWDNRVVNHSAVFDAYPALRHGLRVTPRAEKPLSVEEYEAKTGKKAKDWLEERHKSLGIKDVVDKGESKVKGYRD